ncbi:hypothetical protein [Prosthecobacter sp.]|uniref:hypothetical protein n=1 Tax=Prosthecobacter sp. TaxID=1965333 RepID=UPI002AB9D470|nr:hypothetical protein [Prosthecobacter sp.]MDZ4401202.1 hypothetical protein [Prosthecobacter sp.]
MPVKSVFLHLTRLWLSGGRWVVMFACLVFFAWCYMRAFQRQGEAGASIHEQERMYLNAAIETRRDLTPDFSKGVSKPLNDWLPHHTDGVVRPLWPWLAAWSVAADHVPASSLSVEDQRVLRSGKRWLFGLSLGFLLMLGLAAARVFSVPAALLTILTIGFGVLLPSAAMFSPDVLFQLLFLLTWVCCIAALKRNSLWLYGVIGFFSALANLALPSATSLVLVFIFVSTLRWLWGMILAYWSQEGGTTLWVWRNHWLGMILLVVCHLITVGPMLAHSKEKLGDAAPFFWRWFDDENAMRQWTAAHQTREALQAVPVGEVPSYANYLESHAPDAVSARLSQGSMKMIESVLQWPWSFDSLPQERGVFVAVLAAVLILLILIVWFVAPRASHAGQALHPETAPLVFFTVLAFVVCMLDFGWDMSVLTWGNRHLALYPPLVLSLLWASESLVHRARRRKMRLPVFVVYEMILWALSVLVVLRA